MIAEDLCLANVRKIIHRPTCLQPTSTKEDKKDLLKKHWNWWEFRVPIIKDIYKRAVNEGPWDFLAGAQNLTKETWEELSVGPQSRLSTWPYTLAEYTRKKTRSVRQIRKLLDFHVFLVRIWIRLLAELESGTFILRPVCLVRVIWRIFVLKNLKIFICLSIRSWFLMGNKKFWWVPHTLREMLVDTV